MSGALPQTAVISAGIATTRSSRDTRRTASGTCRSTGIRTASRLTTSSVVVRQGDLRLRDGSGAATSASTASTRSPIGASAGRVRDTDRLSNQRARRMDGRLAGVPAECRFLVRRRGLFAKVAARPGAGATRRRVHPQHCARSGTERAAGLDQTTTGRTSRDRPAGVMRSSWCRGSCTGCTATATCSPSSGRRWPAGSTTPPPSAAPFGTPPVL